MDAVFIAAAIPLFFTAIGIELWVARRRGRRVYVFHDAMTNLMSGVGQLLFTALVPFLVVGLYVQVFERFRWATIPESSALGWIGAFLAVDLAFYAFHRASHRVNFLWAIHAVHHQSEQYNYSVALRQAWFEPWFAAPFHLPLALVGFSPKMMLTAVTLNTLYQFWVHTRLVQRIGPLEHVLNTPSHHRVHHGRDPKYLDKNYGGMFIVWDFLFGTLQREEEEPVYGVVKPLESWNPLWANLEVWTRLVALARRGSSFRESVWAFFAPPDWRPANDREMVATTNRGAPGEGRYDVETSPRVDVYVGIQFALMALLTTWFLLVQETLGGARVLSLTVWFVTSMVASSGLLEGRRWAPGLELMRLLTMPLLAGWLATGAWRWPVVASFALVAIASGAGSRLALAGARTSARTT